jgi:hypothetical protein
MHLHSNYSKPELGRNSLVVLPGGIVQALSGMVFGSFSGE